MKKTIVYDWTNGINEDELNNVINIIENNGVVIFPTDTVYGIGCSYSSIDGINRLYEFKERDYSKPINVLTDSKDNILKVGYINEIEDKLIDKYFPGALTVILKKKENVPDLLTANLDSVGVRIPNDNIALRILSKLNYPMAVTSANISGEKDSIKIEDFYNNFNGKVDAIINGGESNLKIASTIVRVDNGIINVLREGTIKVEI